jgi:hypothetical protein
MPLKALTSKLKIKLNKSMPAARDAELGDRLGEFEAIGKLAHSYASAHADKTYTEPDLPISPVVVIALTLADAAANLILPATSKKLFVIVNTSGQAVTVKASGQTGFAVANGKTAMALSNGTDFVRTTGDA